jgi:hypothetical protein
LWAKHRPLRVALRSIYNEKEPSSSKSSFVFLSTANCPFKTAN